MEEGAAALLQVRERRPEAVDHPEEVDVEDAAELLRLEPLGLRVDGHDRVRAVGVDAAEAVDRLLDHPSDLVLHRLVGRDGERLRVPRRDDDLRTARAGAARDRAAEPARGAGDDDDLLAQRFLPRHVPCMTENGLRYAS